MFRSDFDKGKRIAYGSGVKVLSVPKKEEFFSKEQANDYALEAKEILQEQKFEEMKKVIVGVLSRRWNRFVQRVLESTV